MCITCVPRVVIIMRCVEIFNALNTGTPEDYLVAWGKLLLQVSTVLDPDML